MPPGPDHRPPSGSRGDDIRREIGQHEAIWVLERRVERQGLVLEALAALLAAHKPVTEPALSAEVTRLEAARRSEPPTVPCSRCSRPVGRRETQCVYCGEPRAIASVFETI